MTTAENRSDRVEETIRREGPALLAYFERRVEVREDAADLLADTLLVLWRRAESLPSDPENVRMWLCGVARNTLSSYRRGRRRHLELAERMRSELASAPAPSVPSSSLDLSEALDRLNRLDREIVVLAAWDGFTLAEIARHLRMRPTTVRSRYSRARAKLRATLDSTDSVESEQTSG